ncbi:MAG: class I SAM-dependent methyltransferase [Candidatus Acidiferrales bacterium]
MAAEFTCCTSKTLSWSDLRADDVAPVYADLRRFALRLGVRGTRFAVNGILKRRWWVRRGKMWEYARALSCIRQDGKHEKEVMEAGEVMDVMDSQRAKLPPFGERSPRLPEHPNPPQPPVFRVLDFGGGATLPVFWLAERGAEVLCLDVNTGLAEWTNRVAHERGWKLKAATHDLTRDVAPADWGEFEAVISFSVLEHVPTELQRMALTRLAGLLRPGGVMALTFDYGTDAAQPFAIRDEAGVTRLVAATGLQFIEPRGFVDTRERFALDKRHASRKFTFGSLMLRK